MLDGRTPKNLKNPVNPVGFARMRKKKIIKPGFLHASISSRDGCARLEQPWIHRGPEEFNIIHLSVSLY